MTRFYLSGQNNFGNRGCEALVRSTLQLLKREFSDVEVLVPSFRPDLDALQWPSAEQEGVHFVSAMPFPQHLKWWGRIRKVLPFIKELYFPNFPIPADIAADIASCDAMLVIGGDNITLDYGIESLIWHIRFAQFAQKLNKKVMIWGASIGPFKSEPAVEAFTTSFLRSLDCITVRESISWQYLTEIKADSAAALVSDGAFVMKPEPVELSDFWPRNTGSGVLAFNISPLIQKFRPSGEAKQVLQSEVASFLRDVLDSTELSILLLPHVDPLDGSIKNSDSHYMRGILDLVPDAGDRISLAPSKFNAAQLKYILSRCQYFIGARTHATIGALSSRIPTISIAYSIKAKGINRDLFGDEKYVLDSPLVSRSSLNEQFKALASSRAESVELLNKRIPEWQELATQSASMLRKKMSAETERLEHI